MTNRLLFAISSDGNSSVLPNRNRCRNEKLAVLPLIHNINHNAVLVEKLPQSQYNMFWMKFYVTTMILMTQHFEDLCGFSHILGLR